MQSTTQARITLLIIVVVIISAAMETDVFVPSFPAIQAYFDINESTTQMILSINFIGLCISSLFYGPLADAFGRRNVLLIGMGIFLIASIGCIFANSIESLLFWRFVQGLGSSAGFVIPSAIIFDVYTKAKAVQVLGFYNSIITIVIAGAPMIGSYLQVHYGWRANFIFVGLFALFAFLLVLFGLKESMPVEKRHRLHLKTILKSFGKLLTNRQVILSLTIICTIFGAFLVYIANLSLIFINHLNIDERIYAFYQGAVLGIFAVVSLTVASWIKLIGMQRTKLLGQLFSIIGAVALFIVAIVQPNNPLLITMSMCLFITGFALMINMVFGDYMSVFPDMKGISSALVTSIRLFSTSLAIAVASAFFNGTIMPVAIFVVIFCAIATVAMIMQTLD